MSLERAMQMKREGKSEPEIISALRQEGMNPMEISDTMNQLKIKQAVAQDSEMDGMTPSIMQNEEAPTESQEQYSSNENTYSPQSPPAYSPSPQPTFTPNYGAQDGYDSQYEYGAQDGYAPADYSNSTDTIIEISEQVFAEKIKKIASEMRDFKEFKTIFETKVNDIDERLKRMEKNFDKMQLSILDKVGEYGKGLDYLKKELRMVEDSFEKMNSK